MNKQEQLKAMEGIEHVVAVLNGLKMALVNEGWDPVRAEECIVAQFQVEARKK